MNSFQFILKEWYYNKFILWHPLYLPEAFNDIPNSPSDFPIAPSYSSKAPDDNHETWGHLPWTPSDLFEIPKYAKSSQNVSHDLSQIPIELLWALNDLPMNQKKTCQAITVQRCHRLV